VNASNSQVNARDNAPLPLHGWLGSNHSTCFGMTGV